ncbi:molybdate transport system substrate-binding protein [Paenibacillus anaericanus]|uniref:molybdate ABC transporter substrate-binding protein n=1 Tax=Paenibacillus anaericanus TaxID=170367 RepID=UPI00278A9734|nr:molybdate ABC transporter substrate-binding protein [Paenibacillus anaericanus]MDQ0087164.1 molybdate transport system substrate-binding protein [Paenibacillus anaericanus]
MLQDSIYSKKMRFAIILILMFGLLITACGKSEEATVNSTVEPTEQNTITLTVSAAASLKDSLEELTPIFEDLNPSIKLVYNFGASGSLQKQIEQGAPVDLFLSAGKKQMDALIDKKLVLADQSVSLLLNSLVLIVKSDAEGIPDQLENLKDVAIHNIAVGEPEVVPAGTYARETLESEGLWEELQPKMVFTKDVSQVLTYVESGNADAGFVYLTDALLSDKVKMAFQIDASKHKSILYPAGIIAETKHGGEAEQLLQFLQSKEAQDVFVKYGFTIPE